MTGSSPRRLDDVCEFIVDCLHATAPVQAEGFPLIRTPNIGKGRLDLSEVLRVSEDTYEQWTRRATPQAGDLILAREAPAGNVALVREGERVCLGQRTVHLRPDAGEVDAAFLCYFLLAPTQQAKLLAGETGATSKHVNMRDIRRLELHQLPSLDAQRKCGSLLSAYHDLIENNRRRMALLEDAAQQVYREWFVRLRFPGREHTPVRQGFPEGWERVPFGEALVLQRGFDLPVDQRRPGPVPVYGSTGVVGHHDVARVKGPGIVTGRSGSLGNVKFVDEDYWPLNTALWVKAFSRLGPWFAYFLLQQLDLRQYNAGASVPTLDRNIVHAVAIIVPPSGLLATFDDVARPLFSQIHVLRNQNERLQAARDLLLPRLMSGEIAV